MLTSIIGYLAALVGTALMLPQVYKSFKTKKVDDISTVMILLYILNNILWEAYGLLIHSFPVILCNLLTIIIGAYQLVLKLKYKAN
jgi:MtN3 and saliva related transmembrane protein